MTCGRYAGADLGSVSAKRGASFVQCHYNKLQSKFSNIVIPYKLAVFGTIELALFSKFYNKPASRNTTAV